MSAQTVDLTPIPGDLGYWTEPANLTAAESIHYRRGFSRGARTHLKKHGGPAVIHDGPAPTPGTPEHRALVAELAEKGRAYRADRHDACHKAGMSAVRSYLRKSGQSGRLAEIVDPCAPAKRARKAPAKSRKLAAVPDVTPEPATVPDELAAGIDSGRVILTVVSDAPATVPAPMPPMTWAARKATRREIAAKLRAQGIRPTGEAWREACRAAGLVSDEVTSNV